MMFRPAAHNGGWICLGGGLGFSLLGGWLAGTLPGHPVSGGLFWRGFFSLVSFGLAIYCFYLALALFRLAYFVSRNGLQIRWGGLTRRIPLGAISAIAPAGGEIASLRKRLLNVELPDWWVGRWQGVEFYNTIPAQQSLVAQTQQETVVISPADPQEFLRAWRLRIPLGPTQTWSSEVLRWPFFGLPFWFDPLAWRLAGGAVLLCLILIGATMTAYPTWPPSVPISFNAFGQTNAVASREQVLWFPVVGAGMLLLNLVLGAVWYQKERLAAYLLWAVASLAQIALWVGIRAVVG